MTIRLEFNRIAPGVEIGPHSHEGETIVYLAGGELVYEHGEGTALREHIRPGDVLYEAPGEVHRVRNEGPLDALALLAAVDPAPDAAAGPAPDAAPRPAPRAGHGAGAGTTPLPAPAAAEPVRRAADARVLVEADIKHTFLVEPGDFGSLTFTITEVEIAPGGESEWHRHPGSEHAIVVFEGRGTITVGDVDEILEPLKGIRVLPGRRHRVRNDGRHRLRYYVCATPGTDPTVDRVPADAPSRHLDA